MTNNSARVKILYLEADNADADSVGALVGIVREVQGGRAIESVAAQLEPAAPSEAAAPPLALPPKERKARKPRELKAATAPSAITASGAPRKRVANVSASIVAAVAKSKGGVVNYEALAEQLYGAVSDKTLKRTKLAVYAAATAGKIVSTGPGKYTVLG